MTDTAANTYINDVSKVKKDVENLIVDSSVTKLTGPLTIKGFQELKTITLKKHDLTELIIEDCPILHTIHVNKNDLLKKINLEKVVVDGSGKGIANKIKEIIFSGDKSGVEELNLKNCAKLGKLHITDLGKINKVKGAADFDEAINDINLDGSTGLSLATTDELADLKGIKEAVKEIFGKGDDGKVHLPTKTDPNNPGKQIIDTGQLKGELGDKTSGTKITQLLTEINSGAGLGLPGSDIVKDKIIAKIKELKQDLLKKINDLGLNLTGADITEQNVLNKIKALVDNGPNCSHTDYDDIKAERDRLKIDNIGKADMIVNDKNILGKLGISISEYEGRIVNVNASRVEKTRNELIEKRFGELSNEKNTAFYINIGLSVLAIGSLAAVIWLLLRENKDKTEPELEKEPAKIKKF